MPDSAQSGEVRAEQLIDQINEMQNANNQLRRKIARLERDNRFLSVMNDNAERLRTFNEAEKELQFLYNKLLLAHCPGMIFLFGTDLNFVIGTKVGLDMLGYSDPRELNNLSLDKVFAGRADDEWVRRIHRECDETMADLKPRKYHDHIPLHSGAIHGRVTISPIPDGEGGARGIVLVINDVTDLSRAQRHAEDAARAKSAFLANMSHEIRTPMNAIKGLSELMMLTDLNGVQRDYAANIVSAADTLVKIINDVLDFSKIDANKIELVETRYDLASLFCDVTNVINLKAVNKGITLLTDIDPSLPAELCGDDIRLKQVLINVLSNAVKYTHEGYVRVGVRSKRLDGRFLLTFTVEDSGIGIREEDLPSLFDAFSQLDVKNNRSIIGTGLGLAIAKQLVQLMGGDISVDSEYGKGSTFTFWVEQKIETDQPLAVVDSPEKKRVLLLDTGRAGDSCADKLRKLMVPFDYCQSEEEFGNCISAGGYTHLLYNYDFAHDIVERSRDRISDVRYITIKDMRLAAKQHTGPHVSVLFEPILITELARLLGSGDAAQQKKRERGRGVGAFQVSGANALVVDDNAVNLMVSGELLKHYGLKVAGVESGTLALKACQYDKFDIIFMDHMMPDMDGVETTERIRRGSGANRDTPIIALTANAVSGVKDLFLSAGMNDFITKPIDVAELNRVLRVWLPEDKVQAGTERDGDSLPEVPEPLDKLEAFGVRVAEALDTLEGNTSIYLTVLETFAKDLSGQIQLLQRHRQSDNWDGFAVEVHGLKGALANIGARDLSREARNIEYAAKERRSEYIQKHFGDFVERLCNFENVLGQLDIGAVAAREEHRPQPPDEEHLRSGLERVAAALEALENEQAMVLLEELEQYTYGPVLDRKLAEIHRAVELFDYDSALDCIHEGDYSVIAV